MNNIRSKFSDPKIIALAALGIGIILGLTITEVLINIPRINKLNQIIDQQQEEISSLENQLDELQEENTNLEETYNELVENSVSLNQYNQLQQEHASQETQVEELQSDVEQLETVISLLNEENNEIKDKLDDLQTKYDSIYNPLYVSYTINDLRINLTVNTDIYPENTEISGNVSITTINGVPFYGDFKLSLTKIYQNQGISSDYINIVGSKEYTWNHPFSLGRGSYKLSLQEIRDWQGNLILDNKQLKPYAIKIFHG